MEMPFNPDPSNKLRKCCFLIKLRRQIIQILYLMETRYKSKIKGQSKAPWSNFGRKNNIYDHITSKLTTVNQ